MTPDLLAPIARIILRYIAGYTAARVAANPDTVSIIALSLSIGCSFASEFWYWLARKRGWKC